LISGSTVFYVSTVYPAQCPVSVSFDCPPFTESPFARSRCYLLAARYLTPHQGALPPLHSSYRLMRQTKFFLPPRFHSLTASLCRLLRVPAGRWPFPTLSLQSLRRCLDPYPAAFLQCICSLLPEGQRPHLRRQRFGTPDCPYNATSTGLFISRLQSFLYVQAPTLARPPGCTHRCGSKSTG
jgi:hypothetical protein